MGFSPCSTGTVAALSACSQSGCDFVMAPVEHPSPLEQSPTGRKRPAIARPCIRLPTPPQKCAKTEPGTNSSPVDCDAPLASVRRKPIKASVNRDIPANRSLKLRLLPDQYVSGAFFVYSLAHSLHALASDNPQSATSLQERAIVQCREMCDILVTEFTSAVHKDLDKETWGARPQGGLPELFASLAEHVVGNVVLLPTNTYNIVTSSFGMDTTLTSGWT